MQAFNRLLVLLGLALAALVLGTHGLSASFMLLALLEVTVQKVRRRREERHAPDTGFTLAAAVVQGMAWAQRGRVYQLDAADDHNHPTRAQIGRTVVDPLTGETLFLPEIAVVEARFVPLPALATPAG